MRAPLAYEREPYRTELQVRVVATGEDGGRHWAVLDDTVLYPEGGGQPSDTGSLAGVAVVDVRRVEGEVRHTLAAAVAKGPADLRLDWARRFDHMQQHTGQHLLTAVATDRFGWETTAFHLGAETCDVELAVSSISEAEAARLEEEVASVVREARPVRSRRVSVEELQELPVRTRGLPDGHTGDVRLVEIEGVDLNTCGGTHLRSTAEIEALKLLGTERLRGGTRLFFVAGGRARRRLGAHEARSALLRALLGVPDTGLAEAVEAKLGQLADRERELRDAEEDLAQARADSLAAAGAPLAEVHFDGRDLAFLSRVGKRFAALPVSGVAFLTSAREGAGAFLLAAGGAATVDLRPLGAAVAEALDGRGGGSGKLYQGKANIDRRGAALDLLRSRLGA